MKHLKEKLIATIAMLLVATVMLTSASFAWFTISTNPEISNIQANVTTNQNLEIALDNGTGTAPAASASDDSGKNTTWGNLVDLNKFFADNSTRPTLKPVLATISSASQSLAYPKFGLDGRVKETTNLTKKSVGTIGSGTFSDLNGVFVWSEDGSTTKDKVWAFEVDYWLRSNQAATVSLSDKVKRDDSDSAETGLGSYVSNKDITIKLVANNTVYSVVPDSSSTADGYKLTLKNEAGNADATISLAANTATLVKMFVYLDGKNITNATFPTDSTFKMNVQFKNSTDLTSMKAAEATNGRTTPTA